MKKEYGVIYTLDRTWINTYIGRCISLTLDGVDYIYDLNFCTTEVYNSVYWEVDYIKDEQLINKLTEVLLNDSFVVSKFLDFVDEQISLIAFRKDLLNYIKNIN